MLTGRLLLMLVVMTATIAVRQPALARAADPINLPAERTTWVQRLGTGVTRTFSRIGLMQRVTLRTPAPRPVRLIGQTARVAATNLPDLLRSCLPPPIAV